MKKLCTVISLLLFPVMAMAELSVSAEPVRPTVRLGEYIQLALSSPQQISRIDYPVVKDAVWAKNLQYNQTRSINGNVTYIRIIALSPQKTGTVTIPPFKVYSGKDSALTSEIKVRVLERTAAGENGDTIKLADAVRGMMTLLPDRSKLYTGEEMTLNCDLLIDERAARLIRVNYYPELNNVDNALFTTWQTRDGKVRFSTERPRQITEDGKTFLRYRFTARCRVLKPGAFDPGAAIRVNVVQSRSSSRPDPFDDPFGDSFFDSFFSSSRVEPYTVEFKKAPAVSILPLPPVPAGVINTGLVGKWQISGALSGSSLRQGEAAELTLLFSGSGTPDSFVTPKLELPGFRVYPPEVVKRSGSVSVKYAVIPLEPGEKVIELRCGTFDPESGWQSRELRFKTAVVKSAAAAAPAANVFPAPPAAERKNSEPEKAGSTPLHYQKNTRGTAVKTPLMMNSLFWTILFAAGMPLLALLIEFRTRKKEKEADSPELRQHRNAAKALAELQKELKHSGDTPEFREKLLPLLGEVMGLSAGVTAGEIAEKVDDPELQRYFADLDSAAFLPEKSSSPELSPSGRKALGRFMKKFMVITLIAAVFTQLSAAGLNENFNKGEYKKAAAGYLQLAKDPGGYRPDMLFNYGNCQYHLGNMPEARYALQLAALLHPWDREIRENLAAVNSLLFQNEEPESSFTAMLRSLRDLLRCDIYIMLTAFFWGAIWICWSFRRKLSGELYFSISGVLAALMLIALISAVTQLNSTYSARRVTVIVPELEMRSLPGIRSGRVETTISGGGDGELLRSEPGGFSLVRINGREGWVDSKALRKTLPGGVY